MKKPYSSYCINKVSSMHHHTGHMAVFQAYSFNALIHFLGCDRPHKATQGLQSTTVVSVQSLYQHRVRAQRGSRDENCCTHTCQIGLY